MKKTTLIDIGFVTSTIAFTGFTIWMDNLIDLIPKFPWHPALSIIALIYFLVISLFGFIKILDKISDVFSKLRMKNL